MDVINSRYANLSVSLDDIVPRFTLDTICGKYEKCRLFRGNLEVVHNIRQYCMFEISYRGAHSASNPTGKSCTLLGLLNDGTKRCAHLKRSYDFDWGHMRKNRRR